MNEVKKVDYNPWHPMTDLVDLKTTGKAMEELGECISAIARCQIQGIDEKEPVTGLVNRQWLTEEIADVYANLYLLVERFNLNKDLITTRSIAKEAKLREWHRMA